MYKESRQLNNDAGDSAENLKNHGAKFEISGWEILKIQAKNFKILYGKSQGVSYP